MTTKITADNLSSSLLNTIQSSSGTPKITNIQVTNDSYTVLDDTAVDVTGGYIKLTGTGFASGCQVLIGTTAATSTTFVSATEVRAQVPAMTAGTYIVYLINSDGGVSIRVNGLTYSASPIWNTSSLSTQIANQAISIQLSASGASTYSLAAGSSLPAGLTLTSGGLLSGTVTGLIADTTYTFTIVATDTENQDSPRQFSLLVTIVVVDPYFNRVSLLLPGTGTNNANNNTFIDSSTNNFAITRNGNTTQGTFSPYSPAGWSNYFDGSGDYLSCSASAVSGLSSGTSGDYTVEAWVYLTALPSGTTFSTCATIVSGSGASSIWQIWGITPSGYFSVSRDGNTYLNLTATTPALNTWNHIAFVNSGTTITVYLNGTSVGTMSSTGTWAASATNTNIGGNGIGSGYLTGYISNLRLVSSAVYTGNFTPPSAPLTAISGTSLLTCQSNRFVDNSTNNFAITRNGDAKVTNWSPFAPTGVWQAGTAGGSAYFDGTGDYLSSTATTATQVGSGNFTTELWVYLTNRTTVQSLYHHQNTNVGGNTDLSYGIGVDSAGKLTVVLSSGSSRHDFSSANGVLTTGQWYHIALVRNGNVFTLYVNGTSVATTTAAITLLSCANNYIGVYINIGANDYQYTYGYISDFRIVKGTAVYTNNFTPPTEPLTAIANTGLLCNFSNAGIIDATTRNVLETVGNTKISTTQSKYGGSSIYFDGTGDSLVASSDLTANFGSADFTIELWVYCLSLADYMTLFDTRLTSVGIQLFLSANGQLFYDVKNGSNTQIQRITTSSGALSTNQWYHIAICRSSSTTRIFVNGVLAASAADTNSYTSTTNRPVIGSNYSSGEVLNGYISDLRVTKGIARYTTTFTPPSESLPLQMQ